MALKEEILWYCKLQALFTLVFYICVTGADKTVSIVKLPLLRLVMVVMMMVMV